jgi:hypothetical protein
MSGRSWAQPVIDLTLDCSDASLLASFWKLALGYVDEPAPAPFNSRNEWLASKGVPENDWEKGLGFVTPRASGPVCRSWPCRKEKYTRTGFIWIFTYQSQGQKTIVGNACRHTSTRWSRPAARFCSGSRTTMW